MKRIFQPALAAIAFFSVLQSLHAQQQYNQKTSPLVHVSAPIPVLENTVTSEDILESNTNLKTTFVKMFPGASQEHWSKQEKGYWVSFQDKGRKIRAGFTLEGKFNYSISDCAREKLPTVLRNEIKNNYSGYQLTDAIEIRAFDQVTYQVVLESHTGYVSLKSDGTTIEINKQFSKSH